LSIADLPDEIREFQQPAQSTEVTFPDEGVEMERLVADFEHSLIQRALERSGGNKRQAADLLHLKRTTLIEKLRRLERH
jgi:DNA-binding NtrC family response regulator